jgi:hypothetical protein
MGWHASAKGCFNSLLEPSQRRIVCSPHETPALDSRGDRPSAIQRLVGRLFEFVAAAMGGQCESEEQAHL